MQPAQTSKQDRSIGELLGDLSRDTVQLVQKEFALAKAEVSQKASSAAKHLGLIAAGGALAYAGLIVLLGAIVLLLVAAGLPAWASALIVGLVCAIGGGLLAKRGLDSLRKEDLTPRQTIETLKETVH